MSLPGTNMPMSEAFWTNVGFFILWAILFVVFFAIRRRSIQQASIFKWGMLISLIGLLSSGTMMVMNMLS